jgi:hypothetical protein
MRTGGYPWPGQYSRRRDLLSKPAGVQHRELLTRAKLLRNKTSDRQHSFASRESSQNQIKNLNRLNFENKHARSASKIEIRRLEVSPRFRGLSGPIRNLPGT